MLTHKWPPISFEVVYMEELAKKADVTLIELDHFVNNPIFPPETSEELECAIRIITTALASKPLEETLGNYLMRNQCHAPNRYIDKLFDFKIEEQKEVKRRKKRGVTDLKVDALTNLWAGMVRREWKRLHPDSSPNRW